MPNRYWLEEHHQGVALATDFYELWPIAKSILSHMQRQGCSPIEMVCGPISTGRFDIETNNFIFQRSIEYLVIQQKRHIFNQLPFEDRMKAMYQVWSQANRGYCMPILDEVYTPIFRSGIISRLIFIPGWELSFGAKWEHSIAPKCGIQISYLPDNWFDIIGVRTPTSV